MSTFSKPISVILVFIFSISLSRAQTLTDATELYEKMSESACIVLGLDEFQQEVSMGSGFTISTSGDIVTNAHVVQGASSVNVECNSKRGTVVRVTGYSEGVDLVRLKTNLEDTKPVNIGQNEDVKPGAFIFIIGNPLGLSGSITPGLASGTRTLDEVNYIQLSASINPGNSGGMVVTSNEEVIGIATSRSSRAEAIGFAIPASYIQTLESVNLSIADLQPALPKLDAPDGYNLQTNFSFRNVPLGSSCEEAVDHFGGIENNKNYLFNSNITDFQENHHINNYSIFFDATLMGEDVYIELRCEHGIFLQGKYLINKLGNPELIQRVTAALQSQYGKSKTKREKIISWTSIVTGIYWELPETSIIRAFDDHKSYASSVVEFYVIEYENLNLSESINTVQALKALNDGEL